MSNELPSPTTNCQIRWSSSLWCNHLLQQPSSWVYQRQGSGAAFKGPGSDGPWRYGDRRLGVSDSGPNAEWCDLKHSTLPGQSAVHSSAGWTDCPDSPSQDTCRRDDPKGEGVWHLALSGTPIPDPCKPDLSSVLSNLQTPLLKEVETIWRHGKQTSLTLQIAGILSCNS